jgi:hypothetical protein
MPIAALSAMVRPLDGPVTYIVCADVLSSRRDSVTALEHITLLTIG